MCIRMEMFPPEGPAVVTYASRIGDLELSEPHGIWYQYDVAFRKLKALKTDLPWQTIVVEILWPIQQKTQSVDRQASSNGGHRNNQPFH